MAEHHCDGVHETALGLCEHGQTFVLVTHDSEVGAACDRVILMRDGKVSGLGADVSGWDIQIGRRMSAGRSQFCGSPGDARWAPSPFP